MTTLSGAEDKRCVQAFLEDFPKRQLIHVQKKCFCFLKFIESIVKEIIKHRFSHSISPNRNPVQKTASGCLSLVFKSFRIFISLSFQSLVDICPVYVKYYLSMGSFPTPALHDQLVSFSKCFSLMPHLSATFLCPL